MLARKLTPAQRRRRRKSVEHFEYYDIDYAIELRKKALRREIAQKDRALAQKDEALAQKDQALVQSAMALYSRGMSVEAISETTSLSLDRVREILGEKS